MQMTSFKTLDLAIEFYDQILEIKVTGNLKDQLHRAASSISLNLSEGNAKGSANEKRHFFQTSYASLRECQTILKLLKETESKAFKTSDQLGAYLYRLVNSDIKASPNWRRSHSDI
jgi:four helix bundle protein